MAFRAVQFDDFTSPMSILYGISGPRRPPPGDPAPEPLPDIRLRPAPAPSPPAEPAGSSSAGRPSPGAAAAAPAAAATGAGLSAGTAGGTGGSTGPPRNGSAIASNDRVTCPACRLYSRRSPLSAARNRLAEPSNSRYIGLMTLIAPKTPSIN